MQARLFSYLDTQLTRLGGPNFTQLPINRPHCPVNDMLRDGMHQTAIHTGAGALSPEQYRRRRAASSPTPSRADTCRRPRQVEGPTVRAQPASFDDHFTQAAMFYRSLTDVEQAHVIEAFTFELGKCLRAGDQGTPTRGAGQRRRRPVRAGGHRTRPARTERQATPRTSSSRRHCRRSVETPGPIDGRKIGIIADADSDLAGVAKLVQAIQRARRDTVGDRSVRRGAQVGTAQRHRRADAADRAVDRVRRARRGRGDNARPATSSSSCCCRRRSDTARRSLPGVTAPTPSRPRVSHLDGPGVLDR